MDLISQVVMLGGVTDRATLLRLRGRKEVDRALRTGLLVKDARGRYALASTVEARRTANTVAGVLSHASAAVVHGWQVKNVPDLPEVTVPRNRRLPHQQRAMLTPHFVGLAPQDVQDGVTTMTRTLVDCLRGLPFDEALAVADSALRVDDTTSGELHHLAAGLAGPGSAQARRVASLATSKAANPFESALRAIALGVRGLSAEPQCPVRLASGRVIHPDLGDPRLRLAVEAEGFEWHGDSRALTRDCVRYNALATLGWTVVRFSWVQVMTQPAYVEQTLRGVVDQRAQPRRRRPRPAPEAPLPV